MSRFFMVQYVYCTAVSDTTMVSKTAFFYTGKIFHRKVFGPLLQVMLHSMLWDHCPVCLSVTLVYSAKWLDGSRYHLASAQAILS